MELIGKLRRFLAAPRTKLWWVANNFGRLPILVRRGRPGALFGYLAGGLTGWRLYDHYVSYVSRKTGGTVERKIRGNLMALNLEDRGLSRDLFIYGVREERGTELFERELERIGDYEDGVVIEIGANIGYFALMELAALDKSTELIAFEPDERNVSWLEHNLELNDYRDAATIEQAAVGAERGTATFELTDHANLNKVRSPSTVDPDYDTGRTAIVEKWSIDAYLDTHDIDPDSVIAARMDVEGYEVEVLRGMERLLEADGPLVLSLEIHSGRLEAGEIKALGDRLADAGFEVVEVLSESITVYPFVETNKRTTESPREIPTDGPAYNGIFVKPPEEEVERTDTNESGDATPEWTIPAN